MTKTAAQLALVGAGAWGRNYIRTIRESSAATLRAVASSNPETKRFLEPGCDVFDNWQDIITRPGIDGIVIATPPDTHFEIEVGSGLAADIRIELSTLLPKRIRQFHVKTNDATFQFDDGDGPQLTVNRSGTPEAIQIPDKRLQMDVLIDDFAGIICTGATSHESLVTAVETAQLIENCTGATGA